MGGGGECCGRVVAKRLFEACRTSDARALDGSERLRCLGKGSNDSTSTEIMFTLCCEGCKNDVFRCCW